MFFLSYEAARRFAQHVAAKVGPVDNDPFWVGSVPVCQDGRAVTIKVIWLHEDNFLKRLAKHYGCPVELSLEILGGKWKPVILSRLKERPYRYSELRRLIPNLSTKMLTQRLRDLEQQGLVERRGISGRPHALYGLTARATSLKPVLQALYDWGQRTATELEVEIRPPSSTHRLVR